MSVRVFDQQNISADTGIVNTVYAGGSPGESIALLRLRNRVNTPQTPYVGGQYLVTIRYHDGLAPREENVAIQTIDNSPLPAEYNETGFQIWQDLNYPLSVQVAPVGAPGTGTVDVVLLHGFV
jgi:hypothetical protein